MTGGAESKLPVSAATGFRALREAAALLLEPRRALIEVTGGDAADYLHRRLSQGVKAMAPGRGAYALLLEGDGRLSLDLLIYRSTGGFLLLVPFLERERTADQLEKYIIMDDVQVARAWSEFDVISIAGPASPEVIASVGSGTMATGADPVEVCTTPWKLVPEFHIGGTPALLMRDGRWLNPMYHLALPRSDASAAAGLLAACEARGGGVCGALAFEVHRLLEGVPAWGRELAPGMIPLEAGLAGALDFNKGCFPGQEFLARIRNLGHPARLLARLAIDGEFEIEGDSVIAMDGDDIGRIACAATFKGLGRTAASGYIAWSARAANSCVVRSGGMDIPARIASVVDRETYDNNKKPTL